MLIVLCTTAGVSNKMAAAIATWSFGLEAVKIASSALEKGVSSVDAVEMAINS